jgi:hypothetical protein
MIRGRDSARRKTHFTRADKTVGAIEGNALGGARIAVSISTAAISEIGVTI